MKTLGLVLMLLIAACSPEKTPPGTTCDVNATPQADLTKDGILVIGDSISMGYFPDVKAALPAYDVLHNACNAGSTLFGLKHIDQWLGYRPHWRLVTINQGIHDASKAEYVPLDQYRANLYYEILRIKERSDDVIFFTSTVIPANSLAAVPHSIDDYNAAAVAVMNELNVTVYDLNAVSAAIPDSDRYLGVHYTSAGYQTLANFVVNAINTEL